MTPDELAQAYAHAGSLERLGEQLQCSASAAMNRLRRAGVARRRAGRPLSRRMALAVELLRLYREAGERIRPRRVAQWAGLDVANLLTSYRRTYGPIGGRRRSR
jgi:hypothetical protein